MHDAVVMSLSADDISRAIVLWTGYETETWPSRDDDRFALLVGADAAIDLLPEVRRLESEFYESKAHNTVAGIGEMARAAAAEFRERHPELSEQAVEALAWCYAWEWK